MRHLAISLTLALSLALLAGAPVSAQTDDAQPASAPTTIEGRALGEHVSGHAPEHPLEQGRLFGECVSELAITGLCPEHDTDDTDV
jgi:hypothetical protein